MNRLSAVRRCTSPASTVRHSAASMTRGMTSNGQARSMPRPSAYTVKVMPIVRMSRSAWSWRACSSADPSSASWAMRSAAAGRAVPSAASSSSHAVADATTGAPVSRRVAHARRLVLHGVKGARTV